MSINVPEILVLNYAKNVWTFQVRWFSCQSLKAGFNIIVC